LKEEEEEKKRIKIGYGRRKEEKAYLFNGQTSRTPRTSWNFVLLSLSLSRVSCKKIMGNK
jgi:hypothetical protein